ncbi:MAG: hypothetical protein K0R52_431 [Alphaproteobacteria bacterium]|jgi:ATP-dependent exoDNAse (exonuclease V) alpha subunit|nr:hypothetical protein [Alphaproteobacteria bacterium]
MNFFHLSIGHISRSTGRGTVQNVAYITGEILYEERRGLKADYANNRGKTTWATMAPLGSGIEENDLSFWDKLESFEDFYAEQRFKNPATLEKYLSHARVGQTYELSLPKELTREQNIALVRDVTVERFVSKGLVATYAINWNEGNPHVHITVSTRTVWNGEISWDKSVARLLTSQKEFRETRKIFAQCINTHQEQAGLSDRVDWRSYADRGIDLIPTHHKGWQAHQLEREGLFSRIAAQNAEISEENKQRIAEEPEIILRELTSKKATFSERDVVKLVQYRLQDEAGIVSQHVIYSVMKQAVEVGVGYDDIKRYTSADYKAREDHILESLEAYKDQTAVVSISQERVDGLLAGEASWLNAGQKEAVKTLSGDAKFSVLIGRAGTGKTTALQYVVQLHQEAGYTVLGMAPSATAAHELRKGAGCQSDTIAHYAYHWKPYFEALEELEKATTEEEREHYRELAEACKITRGSKGEASKKFPDQNTLILVDEIGMVGTGDALEKISGGWHALIKIVNATGAKLMVVGDDHQAKPVEAGDVLPKVIKDFKDTGNICTLTEIQRQKAPWMKEASAHLAELRTGEALGMYENQGHIQSHEINADVYQDMARQYLRNLVAQPDSEVLAMAYTNEEVRELNGAIRAILKENGLLAAEDLLTRKKQVERDPEGFLDNRESIETEGEKAGSEVTEREEKRGKTSPRGGETEPTTSKAKNQATGQTEGEKGKVKKEKIYIEEGYTIGDKIVFTKNDRGFWTKFDSSDPSFFVRNGTQGRIESITPCRMKEWDTGKLYDTHKICVRVEEDAKGKGGLIASKPTFVSFYLREYSYFQHGYAVTIHKTQGATGDSSLLKLSRYMDAYMLYVAMTRHREDISAYYAKEDFADFPSLLKSLGKVSQKDLAADYSILEESMEFWSCIQEYKDLGFELMSVCAFARHVSAKGGDETDKVEQERAWATVRELKEKRKGLAKLILEDWDVFKDFARQAGLTFESIEIAAGVKKRPLSRREEQARLVVEQYASVAIETRQVWHTIRRTHPGRRAKTHPEWRHFEALRDQRGLLANQISQDPVLYRPFLKDTAKTFEEEGVNNHFGYGLHIIKAQSEAHHSKMLQQEMLKDTSDPALIEKLQTLLAYVEARDLSASLWKGLKPRLEAFKGTLLSEGFCKEIDEWREMRGEQDQLALKIVDSWEDYHPLIQKLGMNLNFEVLIGQKDRAVLDNLLKTYTTSSEETAKLHAAFEIKALMDEDREAKKKVTVAQVYAQGVLPKDIARHALEYQKLKLFEGLKTEAERQLFLLLDEYDDKCREANRAYVVCLNEIEEMKGNLPNENSQEMGKGKERDGQEETQLKPWDAPSWPIYQKACKPRNQLALEIFDQSNHGEVLALAGLMGLNLREVELEQIFLRGERAFRDTHIEKYLTSLNEEEKGKSALALINLMNSEKRASTAHVSGTSVLAEEQDKGEEEGEPDRQEDKLGDTQGFGKRRGSVTARQLYDVGIDFKELRQVANAYHQNRVLQTLDTEEDIKIFHTLQRYEKATYLANKAYKVCIEEVEAKSVKVVGPGGQDIRIWETPSFKIYAPLAAARNEIARILFEDHDIDRMVDLSRKMGMSLDVSKFITQVENGMRDFYLETFKGAGSGFDQTSLGQTHLVKAVSAAEIYGLVEADERQGSKKTFGALKGKGISASDVRDYVRHFNRLGLIESLSTEAEKALFRLYSTYDYHAVIAKGIYRQCAADQESLGIKPSESEHFPAWREAALARNAAALAFSKDPGFLKCLELVEQKGFSIDRKLIFSHAQDGYREQIINWYKTLSPSTEAEHEMLSARLADHLVKIIQDDQEEGHKKTLFALYQAGLNPKDVFAAARDFQEFVLFNTLETEEEQEIFGLVFRYKNWSEKANRLYQQCAEDREKLGIKVSDNPLYPDYLATVSERNKGATALLGSPDWDLCWHMADSWGVTLDEDKLIEQSRDSHRQILINHYLQTDSLLVKLLIARDLKEMMDQDQKRTEMEETDLEQTPMKGQKVTVADLYRHNIFPKDIHAEARQFDRIVTYANLTNDNEKKIFSLLEQYNDMVIQSNRHYSACFQEAEEQGIKKEKTASYALFQEVLKDRQKTASLIQHAGSPHLIEWIAEELGVTLKTLDKDCRDYDTRLKNLAMLSQPQNQEIRPSFKAKEEEPEWKPILPVPQSAPPLPDQSNYYKREDMRHAYKDAQGNLLGYVVRLVDRKTGKKETPPITWCVNKEGEHRWKWKGFGDDNRSLYGLDRLAQHPDKPVLVVEGEKTADIAQKRLPEFVVISWIGGTGAPHKSNWEPLKGKAVAIWPDNDFDGKGLKAAQKVQEIIFGHNEATAVGEEDQGRSTGHVGIVILPEGVLENTWDLADDLPTGWTMDTVRQMIKEALTPQDKSMATDDDVQSNLSHGEAPLVKDSEALLKEEKIKPFHKDDPLLEKREQFEQGRFLLNQEWCEKFHFYEVHGRFPNPDELADTWWQAERLTAIEGRLYHQNLTRGVSIALADLCQEARQAFLKSGNITSEAKETINAALLRHSQAGQVEQHILFHKDRTGSDPSLVRIQEIIEAVKEHEGTGNFQVSNDVSRFSNQYLHLIEQQEILAVRMEQRSFEGGKETSSFLDNKDNKIAKLNLQITRTLEFERDCQQREVDKARGLSI